MRDSVRAFVAIDLPEEGKRQVARLIDSLRQRVDSPRVRWVRPEGVHITLKFLGNVEVERLPAVVDALRGAVEGTGTFRLRLAEIGAFPSLNRPRVVWLGVQGDLSALGRLQQRVEQALARLGFPRETRPFTAHITLARVRAPLNRSEVERLEGSANSVKYSPVEWQVHHLLLMRSELKPEGARYSKIEEIRL